MTDPVSPVYDLTSTVGLLAGPGQVVEIRALADNAVHSGYFNDYAALARFAAPLDADPAVHGMYLTLNRVNPSLLSRRANRIKLRLSRSDATTSDADITRRRWFPIDIDPVRPSGVSSTDAEHTAALAMAHEIAAWLTGLGFPEPIIADSGNGAHLLYRIDSANDPASAALVKQGLVVLDALFSSATATVDTANYNAGRIWKLYGTGSRKGDNTPERPHRMSRLIAVPEPLAIVSGELLEKLGSSLPPEAPAPSKSPVETKGYMNILDLSDWLDKHNIALNSKKPYKNGKIYLLKSCPFSTAHKDGAYAIQFANGAIHAGCHHQSCGSGKQRWPELREMFETKDERQQRLAAHIRSWSRDRAAAKAGREDEKSRDRSVTAGPDNPVHKEMKTETETEPVKTYALTDAGNAERLIALYGASIRYCATFSAWFIWQGNRWVRDDAGKMLIIATDVARSIHREAADAPTADQSRALSRWAIFSESLHARKAMIDSAAPHIPVMPAAFDAQPDLFNCQNGTLDLGSMTFCEHRREDLLTKIAAVDYDPEAECPRWLAHLDLIFSSDADYLAGFQSMCGYTLLGTNPQQIMFILYGKGRNGKSKTIEVLARIFADYAVNIASESLMAKRFETTRSDLARLSGARFATAAEGAEGARMDESIIKQITGEYAITVRKLYENEFEFTPVAKIWLTTNHEPKIGETGDGIWRRLWMVPFAVQIPEEKCDPDIAVKLLSESSGILNWCLAGLARYYATGHRLVQPRKVSQATANLRTVNDTVGLFLAGECTFEAGAMMSRTAFREMFVKWCEEEGIRRVPSGRKISDALRERQVTDGGRTSTDRYWSGIRWKTLAERDEYSRTGEVQDVLGL